VEKAGKGFFFLFLGNGMKRKTTAKTRVQEKNKKDTSNQQRSNEQSTQTQQKHTNSTKQNIE
jgi:hypothetical protein